ncbi:MAG: glycosyltransferase [Gemmataceae bacterium]
MLYLAGALLLLQLFALWRIAQGRLLTQRLPAAVPERHTPWPSVSILIPARDEAAEIEAALRSVLALDYPIKEIVVVNDRSTDATGAILDRVHQAHPELTVVTVTELPAGWLGKNHALHVGHGGDGELLLFTDADVVFTPAALKKAVSVLEADGLDHLTVSPRVSSRGLLVRLMIALFARGFTLFTRPWQARDPRSPAHIGLGAFNLVRRTAYEAVGGHARIALRPDDDLKLGKILKLGGFRQDIRHGLDDLAVAWYPSFPAFVRGLEKNVLAGIDYRAAALFVLLTLALSMSLGPYLLLAFGDATTRLLAGAAIGISWLTYGLFFPIPRVPRVFVFFEPVAVLLLVYTFVRSASLALWRGGIVWRDTFYPLALLKKNIV